MVLINTETQEAQNICLPPAAFDITSGYHQVDTYNQTPSASNEDSSLSNTDEGSAHSNTYDAQSFGDLESELEVQKGIGEITYSIEPLSAEELIRKYMVTIAKVILAIKVYGWSPNVQLKADGTMFVTWDKLF